MYKPGKTFFGQFLTTNISGIPVNADSLPTGVMVRNCVDDFTVQVYTKNVDAGRYSVSGTIPATYNQFDYVNLAMSGYVGGNLGKGIVDLGVLDAADWTLAERSQIRYQLGMDGSFAIPTTAKPAITVSVTGLPQVIMYSGGLDTIMIDGVNLRQALTFDTAVLAGVSSGVGSTIWFDGINSSLARLSAIANSGIRTSISLVLP